MGGTDRSLVGDHLRSVVEEDEVSVGEISVDEINVDGLSPRRTLYDNNGK